MKKEEDCQDPEQYLPGSACPSEVQRNWLKRGLSQPGGKLPLFDGLGKKISERTVRSCLDRGWVEPWFNNPLKRNWIVWSSLIPRFPLLHFVRRDSAILAA